MKTTDQCVPLVILFIMLYRMVLQLEPPGIKCNQYYVHNFHGLETGSTLYLPTGPLGSFLFTAPLLSVSCTSASAASPRSFFLVYSSTLNTGTARPGPGKNWNRAFALGTGWGFSFQFCVHARIVISRRLLENPTFLNCLCKSQGTWILK